MHINQAHYPQLFQEKIWPWGSIRTVFKWGLEPPEDQVSSIKLAPYINDQWLLEDGLELAKTYRLAAEMKSQKKRY